MRRNVVFLQALLACTAIAGPALATEKLDVVASFSILGDMATRIGGERVSVTTLVDANGDAHVYQPTPRDAEAVAGADVILVNGLGFEGFIDRLLEAADYKGGVITAATAVKPIEGFAEEEKEEEGHDHDHGHDHGGIDPHAWQSLANGVLYTAAIADGFCKAAPDDCALFRANAAAYSAELAKLDADVKARVSAIPEGQRKVITSHDAFGYFGREYGITFLAPQGISTDSEASAATVADLIRQIRELNVKVLFVENISDPRLIQQIGTETGASLGGTLYSDALSDSDEAGASYIGMMKHNADALIAAMERGS
jgi:zinc/manganese transport system substrate-binding protein